jgi:hypothetical protein
MELNVWAETVKVIPWTMILQFSAIAIVALIAKRYYDNLASYFMFRSNKDLGKNVKVIINGQEGHIMSYTWRFIYIKLSTGNELVIPISRWMMNKWEICKNGHGGNKSKEDK